MFVRNTKGADLLPGLITAIALAALGLVFVSKFQAGIKGAGTTVDTSANSMSGSLNTAAGAVAAE